MQSLGQRLKKLRVENNLTQEELATYLGLQKIQISQYELDKRKVDDEIKKKVCSIF